MKKIPLTQGKFAIVDEEDYPYISRFIWYLSGDKKYAVRAIQNKRQKTNIFMHQLLIEGKRGGLIMHRNNNGLDNRKANLVIVPEKIIIHHRPINKTGKKSKYKGVAWDKANKKWRVTIKKGLVKYSGGRHKNEKRAAFVYNKLARKLYGEFAYQNDIE